MAPVAHAGASKQLHLSLCPMLREVLWGPPDGFHRVFLKEGLSFLLGGLAHQQARGGAKHCELSITLSGKRGLCEDCITDAV